MKYKPGNKLAGNRDSRKPMKVKQFETGGKDVRGVDRGLRDQFVDATVGYWLDHPELTAEQACIKYADTKGLPRAFWATLNDNAKKRVIGSVVYAKNTAKVW